MATEVPDVRIRAVNGAPIREAGEFVLYWMIAYRRTTWNFALQRAVELGRELGKPVVVLEALRSGYPWASDRLHRFVLDGMAENARRLAGTPLFYYGYVERRPGEGRGLLAALGERAAVVVTDDYPAFFLPRMLSAAGHQLDVRLEKVDSNGLLPMRVTDKVYGTAYAFRRYLQKTLPAHLSRLPTPHPLDDVDLPRLNELPRELTARWPDATAQLLADSLELAELPIDHEVAPVATSGGSAAAGTALRRFLDDGLGRYAEESRHPDADATSGLSPYLHFGHLSSHEVFDELVNREEWDLDRLAGEARGKRSGWWGMSENAEALLDQLVTWRELGFNICAHDPGYDRYESLPDWARTTLAEHEDDERPYLYTLPQLEAAETHDRVWNAAQTQLRRDGVIHNYLRMLWGKKILEWSPHPKQALETMIELNNRYALDGRDPNSYSGIFWCLGRYDRPWGPERPVFGKVRYMSSESTQRKLRLADYLERYAP